MITNYKKIEVKYNNKLVGYLVEKNNNIAFQYDKTWLENGFSISPLSLPLSDEIFISNKNHFDGLYGVFYDSLPDGFGQLLLERMLKKNNINSKKISVLTKLTLLNDTSLGGLTYHPYQNIDMISEEIDLDKISRDLQKIINNEDNLENFDNIYKIASASGGTRPKIHIKIDNFDWIVKFRSHFDKINIGEIEYNTNILAEKCGINIPTFRLLKSDICSGYFATKRFDRKNNKRIHTISLSSILETSHHIPNLDYKYLFQVIQEISVKNDDLYEAFRRMCFNVLCKNRDDHGKNFSFIYDEKLNGYCLSPAYDLTPLPLKLEHEMSVNGQGIPTKEDIFMLQEEFGLKKEICENIYNLVEKTVKFNI